MRQTYKVLLFWCLHGPWYTSTEAASYLPMAPKVRYMQPLSRHPHQTPVCLWWFGHWHVQNGLVQGKLLRRSHLIWLCCTVVQTHQHAVGATGCSCEQRGAWSCPLRTMIMNTITWWTILQFSICCHVGLHSAILFSSFPVWFATTKIVQPTSTSPLEIPLL